MTMNNEIGNIAVLGTGLVGASWAAFFASKGLNVSMHDNDRSALAHGHERAIQYLGFLKEHGVVARDDYGQAVSRLIECSTPGDAVNGAQFVMESATERYEVKKQIFQEADENTSSDCIIASSSSALLMTEIQKVMRFPGRSLIAHPFNPVHLVPLVELVGGRQTDQDSITQSRDFLERLGKTVVILKKEVPGYIGNRLQAALWREAIDMVSKGIGTVEDIDRALFAGPGIRWALMGQHLIFHLGGGKGGIEHFIDHIGESKKRVWEDLASWTTIPDQAKELLSAGVQEEMKGDTIEDRERWRDGKLIALLKAIYGEG